VVFETPALYGDHHVSEVRRVLLQMPGIQEIYASSCFHTVEVSFDPAVVTPETIAACLASAGYLEPLPVAEESGVYLSPQEGGGVPTRHSSTYAGGKQSVSFTQDVSREPRAGWPCPGMGILHGSINQER
jgi:copper chaperone CopZ